MQNTDSQPKKNLPKNKELSFNQEGAIIWLTGLSGSGKTTLSAELGTQLLGLREKVYVLDGDIIRQDLNSDLGFSIEDRKENIRRIGEVAYLFADAAMIVVATFISPFRKDRDAVRNLVAPGKGEKILEFFKRSNLFFRNGGELAGNCSFAAYVDDGYKTTS
jgi:adenylyl-sulfate kinase